MCNLIWRNDKQITQEVVRAFETLYLLRKEDEEPTSVTNHYHNTVLDKRITVTALLAGNTQCALRAISLRWYERRT